MTSCLQPAFCDVPFGEAVIHTALETAQRVFEYNGVSLCEVFAVYQAFASGTGSPDILAPTSVWVEVEAMDTSAAHGYTRYGSVSLAAP